MRQRAGTGSHSGRYNPTRQPNFRCGNRDTCDKKGHWGSIWPTAGYNAAYAHTLFAAAGNAAHAGIHAAAAGNAA